MTGPVAAGVFAVAALLVWTYPITRASHAAARAELARARGRGVARDGGARRPSHQARPGSTPGAVASTSMRELLYEAAKHYRRGRALAERGDDRGAAVAYDDALRDLHAVRPQRMRDVLLAQVYLSRHQLGGEAAQRAGDLRMGYAYARTTAEPNVRALAERLWREAVASGAHRAPPSVARTAPDRAAPRSDQDGARATDAAGAAAGGKGGRRRGRRRSGARQRDGT